MTPIDAAVNLNAVVADANDANEMFDQTQLTGESGWALLGELHSFVQQLGGPNGMPALNPASVCLPVTGDGKTSLREFLEGYFGRLLVPRELPTIVHAYTHTNRYELRELTALDVRLAQGTSGERFARASQTIGTTQLKRLRALRDQRFVQRYLDAVESGEAFGWHTIVYGLVLSLYSLPLRQGLLSYGQQTISGFIYMAAGALKIPSHTAQDLHDEFCARLPQAIDSVLGELLPNELQIT